MEHKIWINQTSLNWTKLNIKTMVQNSHLMSKKLLIKMQTKSMKILVNKRMEKLLNNLNNKKVVSTN